MSVLAQVGEHLDGDGSKDHPGGEVLDSASDSARDLRETCDGRSRDRGRNREADEERRIVYGTHGRTPRLSSVRLTSAGL
ncbi:uncharacterized protein PD653_3934 [Nocardioides sp. PD653]|nr:uncharacterized protein PD653B2_2090 [Nocardioides sp. PD653-B2]GAW56497.1 uncharacterized protein PD653_3934 [Nocardioides sp. PD653]